MINTLLIAGSIVLAGVIIALLVRRRPTDAPAERLANELKDWMRETRDTMQQTRREMQTSLGHNTESLERQLSTTNQTLNDRLDKAANYIAGLQKEIGQVTAVSQTVNDLQKLLYSPKLRGTLGEEILEDLLQERLPRQHYAMQHTFQSGETVDAIVKIGDQLLPVDSKFPLESFRLVQKTDDPAEREQARTQFRKDVRKHIDDIARKYILPQEGTLDFAIMYVPSESVFYEIIDDAALAERAREKKIHLVSPNSFYIYLGAILQGLRGQQVNEQAKRILAALGAIKQEALKFDDVLGVLSTHVTNAKNAADRATSRYQQLSSKIDTVAQLEAPQDEPPALVDKV